MTELYSIKDVARIFGLAESRLRYWIQTGFVAASVRRGGRMYYRFEDLVSIKTAVELLDKGLSVQRVRSNLDALREILAADVPLSRLRIGSDGETVIAACDDVVLEPQTGQLVMSFAVDNLRTRVAEVLELSPGSPHAVPELIADDEPTEAHAPLSAYGWFKDGVDADDRGDAAAAEHCYRQALALEPSLAAAHTNLGNLLHARGEIEAARRSFETALEYEPQQAEARFNLGNLLGDQGQTENAIAELRRVCQTHPEFADAHYNLGLLLARVGGMAQARTHLEQYLEFDASSEWAAHSRDLMAAL